ncbi:MAG: hypothetical protein GF344_18850, partial [Chitinivibrionales bacterium]|nr:hypothetical protein [Chitinivibrionales bacterium]MBD3358701.1 hypothetical protein [Chitinivibrionales bacterium]
MHLLVLLALTAASNANPFLRKFATPRNVRSIIMHENAAWLATSGGIARFDRDGHKLKLYTDFSRFQDLNMTAAAKEGDEAIWFGSHEGNLIRLDLKHEAFKTYNALHAANWSINTMHLFGDHILIGSPMGLAVFSIPKRVVVSNVTQFAGFNDPRVIRIRSWDDHLAVLTPSGIASIKIQNISNTNFADPTLWNTIDTTGMLDISRTNDSTIVGINHIARTIDGRRYTFGLDDNWLRENGTGVYQFSDRHGVAPVNCITKFKNDVYLIGTEGEHFWEWDRSTNMMLKHTINGPTTSNINDIDIGPDGTLWFIGRNAQEGLGSFDGEQWSTFRHNEPADFGYFIGTRRNSDNRVTAARNRDVFLSTISHGIKWYDFSNSQWVTFIDPQTSAPLQTPNNPLESMTAGNLNNWWTLITGVCQDSNGFIWTVNLSARKGHILHVSNSKMTLWRSFNAQDDNIVDKGITDKINTGPVEAVSRNDTNFVYMGFVEPGGLTIVSYSGNPLNDSIKVRPTSRRTSISMIAVEDSNTVWVSGIDGVFRIRNHNPNVMDQIDTLPTGRNYQAMAVLSKPNHLEKMSLANFTQLFSGLQDRRDRPRAIKQLAEYAYHTELLLGYDGDLHLCKPVNKTAFDLLDQCTWATNEIKAEVEESLRDSLINLTNNGQLGESIRSIGVENDPRFVWIGTSE